MQPAHRLAQRPPNLARWAAGSRARAGTSKETTVPITCSACRHRSEPNKAPPPVMKAQALLSSALCSDWM